MLSVGRVDSCCTISTSCTGCASPRGRAEAYRLCSSILSPGLPHPLGRSARRRSSCRATHQSLSQTPGPQHNEVRATFAVRSAPPLQAILHSFISSGRSRRRLRAPTTSGAPWPGIFALLRGPSAPPPLTRSSRRWQTPLVRVLRFFLPHTYITISLILSFSRKCACHGAAATVPVFAAVCDGARNDRSSPLS